MPRSEDLGEERSPWWCRDALDQVAELERDVALDQVAELERDVALDQALDQVAELEHEAALDQVALDDVALDRVALEHDVALDQVALDDVALDRVALEHDVALDQVALEHDVALDQVALLEHEVALESPGGSLARPSMPAGVCLIALRARFSSMNACIRSCCSRILHLLSHFCLQVTSS